jgi:hypothetical protein
MDRVSKRPAFQWYPGDHRRDTGIQVCSFMARALWREMLDLMHEGSPYGHLAAGEEAIEPEELARLVGLELSQVETLLKELERRKVFSRTDKGIIYSRRMVRDEQKRSLHAVAGKMGGNPKLGVDYNKPGFVYAMERVSDGAIKSDGRK